MLYWVDITGRQVLRANVYMGTVDALGHAVRAGLHCAGSAWWAGDCVAGRIYRAQAWGGPLTRVAVLPYDPATVRANDGKCDAVGLFRVGTVDETKSAQAAALYSFDARPERASTAAQIQQQAGGAYGQRFGLESGPWHRVLGRYAAPPRAGLAL